MDRIRKPAFGFIDGFGQDGRCLFLRDADVLIQGSSLTNSVPWNRTFHFPL